MFISTSILSHFLLFATETETETGCIWKNLHFQLNSDIFQPKIHQNCTENKNLLVYETHPESVADLSTLDSFSTARNFCAYVRSYITVAI